MQGVIMKFSKLFQRWIWLSILITALASCAGSEKSESTGEMIDDAAITARIKADMIADKDVKARQINVEVFKGVVQLSGFVNSRAESDKAGAIARSVKGVKTVKNDIIVK
jgi:osmotically-inducible protein OsmY